MRTQGIFTFTKKRFYSFEWAMPPKRGKMGSDPAVAAAPVNDENELCSALESLLIADGGTDVASGLRKHAQMIGTLQSSDGVMQRLAERSSRAAVKYARQALSRASDKSCVAGKAGSLVRFWICCGLGLVELNEPFTLLLSTPDEAIDCLNRAAAGLSVVVQLKMASSGSFAELEVEKLVYHLIVNASEKEQVGGSGGFVS